MLKIWKKKYYIDFFNRFCWRKYRLLAHGCSSKRARCSLRGLKYEKFSLRLLVIDLVFDNIAHAFAYKLNNQDMIKSNLSSTVWLKKKKKKRKKNTITMSRKIYLCLQFCNNFLMLVKRICFQIITSVWEYQHL